MPEKPKPAIRTLLVTPAQLAETGAGVIPPVLALPVGFSVGEEPSEKGHEK